METLPPEILSLPGAEGKSPETRMPSAARCRELVLMVIREDERRSWHRALTKGIYDGNPPKTKVAAGFGWVPNLNFGGMKGLMDSARIPYYALFAGVPTYAVFKTKYQRDDADNKRWCDIIAEEHTNLLKRWKQFHWHMQASQFEMLFEGWGPLWFESPTSWKFSMVPARCLKVPQGSYSCVDERLSFLVVLRDYRIHELWEKVSDGESAEKRGWDVEAVKQAIMTAGSRRQAQYAQDWEHWQQALKNGDLCASYTESDIVRTGTVLVAEYGKDGKPGKVSEFMVSVDTTGAPANSDKDTSGAYLYKQTNQYASYDEAVLVAFQDTGDSTWHSVRGLAMDSFKHLEMSNRLKCQIIKNAFLAATPIIQPGTNNAKDSMALMRMGEIAILAPNAVLTDVRLAGDMSGVMAADRMLTNDLAQNIGHYNQASATRQDGRGEQMTATEAELRSGKETALTQAQIDNYYLFLDSVYERQWERIKAKPDEESRRMIQNCLDRGVPQEAIDQVEWVRANRLSGYPSPEVRKRNLREVAGFFASLPEQGKSNLLDEAISIYCGPDKVDVFNPKGEKPNMDAALAVLENGVMTTGEQPLVVSGQSNVTHLQIHLQDAAEKMGPLNEIIEDGGQIPEEQLMEAYRYISVLGPHCEEHLAPLENDPGRKELHRLFSTQLKNIASFHSKLRNAIIESRQNAQQAQMEQEQATALGIKDQAELASMAQEQKRKDLEAASDIQRKNWKAQEQQKIATFKAGAQTRLKAATALADTQIKKSTASTNGNK
jgi:hypothetical protein